MDIKGVKQHSQRILKMNEIENNQSISQYTDQLIRYYKIPHRLSKTDALMAVLNKVDEPAIKRQKAKKKNIQLITRISAAAVVVIGLVFWLFAATVDLTAGTDDVAAYRLPDGSRVVLQQNSEISYKKYNWNRSIKLNGEAYFEVQSGDDFRVISDLGEVLVLGTRFSVADDRENLIVVCFEGKVNTKFNEESWMLEPGTRFWGEGVKGQKAQFEAEEQFPEYATFQRSFSNQRLAEIVSEIEQFFNVDITLSDGSDKNFTGTIQTGSLENTLEIICSSLQLNYRFTNNNKVEIL